MGKGVIENDITLVHEYDILNHEPSYTWSMINLWRRFMAHY
jgi:hypothetical protein